MVHYSWNGNNYIVCSGMKLIVLNLNDVPNTVIEGEMNI